MKVANRIRVSAGSTAKWNKNPTSRVHTGLRPAKATANGRASLPAECLLNLSLERTSVPTAPDYSYHS